MTGTIPRRVTTKQKMITHVAMSILRSDSRFSLANILSKSSPIEESPCPCEECVSRRIPAAAGILSALGGRLGLPDHSLDLSQSLGTRRRGWESFQPRTGPLRWPKVPLLDSLLVPDGVGVDVDEEMLAKMLEKRKISLTHCWNRWNLTCSQWSTGWKLFILNWLYNGVSGDIRLFLSSGWRSDVNIKREGLWKLWKRG